jgi:hypothetical protein
MAFPSYNPAAKGAIDRSASQRPLAALQHDSTPTGKFQFFVRKASPTPGMSGPGINLICEALESSYAMRAMMRQTEQTHGQVGLVLIAYGRKRLGDRVLFYS